MNFIIWKFFSLYEIFYKSNNRFVGYKARIFIAYFINFLKTNFRTL